MSGKAKHTADEKAEAVKPLPGAKSGQPEGTANYLLIFKESGEDAEEAVKGRREFYEAGVSRSASFRQKLSGWLEDQGIDERQCMIGKPTVFPMLSITCTPEVVKLIQSLPEIDDVVRDSDDLTVAR